MGSHSAVSLLRARACQLKKDPEMILDVETTSITPGLSNSALRKGEILSLVLDRESDLTLILGPQSTIIPHPHYSKNAQVQRMKGIFPPLWAIDPHPPPQAVIPSAPEYILRTDRLSN